MDEPFSALDVHTRQRMETELLALWDDRRTRTRRGNTKTVVFVTHDLEEAIALADEVIVCRPDRPRRVVARHPVTLERPRDLMELRTSPAFVDLYRAIWACCARKWSRSQRAAEPTRG